MFYGFFFAQKFIALNLVFGHVLFVLCDVKSRVLAEIIIDAQWEENGKKIYAIIYLI